MATEVVFARENDVSDILKFIKALAKYEKLEGEVSATEEILRQSLFGKNKHAEVIFLEEDKIRVGYALFFHNFSTFLGKPGLYLEDLFVLPEYRGKGYGKILLKYIAKLAVSRDCPRLEGVVLDWNQPTIDLYRSMGSKPMSEWTIHRVTGEALTKLMES